MDNGRDYVRRHSEHSMVNEMQFKESKMNKKFKFQNTTQLQVKKSTSIVYGSTVDSLSSPITSTESIVNATAALLPAEKQRQHSTASEAFLRLFQFGTSNRSSHDHGEHRRTSNKLIEQEVARKRSATTVYDLAYKRPSGSEIEVARKRSSTTTSSPMTAETTSKMANTSIFKPDPNSTAPHDVSVITHEISFGHDLGMEPAFLDSSDIYPQEGATGNEKRPSEDIQRRSQRMPSVVRSRRVAVLTNNVDNSDRKRQRENSLATFITRIDNNEVYKQRNRYNLDSLRVPRRWMSLRNVISAFNVLVLAVAILTVTLVSYYSGAASTRLAIMSMSNTTITTVMFKLDGNFEAAERINTFTESIYSSPEYPVWNTMKGIRHLYFLMTAAKEDYDQIYVVSQDQTYSGVALDNEDVNTVLVKYTNRTTRPYRTIVRISNACRNNDTSCGLSAFSNTTVPLYRAIYSASTRPFYQHAIKTARPGWSPLYLYADNFTLGVTAVRPVYYLNKLQFVSAVDISLNTLSKYLMDAAISLTGDTASSPLFFVIETATGYIVSTSVEQLPNVDENGDRIKAQDSTVYAIQSSASRLLKMHGQYTEISWPINGAPVVYDDSDSHVIVGHYQKSYGDVDWLVVAYIPFSTYNGKLEQAHFYEIPLMAVLVFTFSIAVSVLVTRAIGMPLKRIAVEMLKVADLNFEEMQQDQNSGDIKGLPLVVTKNKSRPFEFDINLKEVLYLKSAMSAMKTGLMSFAKYVPLEVVTLLVKMKREAVLGVDELDISIMFSDIVNFTSISEQMQPKDLVLLMEEYLTAMSDIIQQNQGVVDKYIGDSIMCFWNAPISVRDHASLCCSVALKCNQKLEDLRQDWQSRGYPDLKMRIGINSGRALVGNVGSSTRLNYTCLGDSVNLASRLESLNKRYGTVIMISEFTANKISFEHFLVRPLDIVTVKGKSRPVKVYELYGFRKLQSEHILEAYRMYEQAFEMYVQGQFQGALSLFNKFQTRLPSDIPVRAKLLDCQVNLDKLLVGPQDQFNPIVHLDEK